MATAPDPKAAVDFLQWMKDGIVPFLVGVGTLIAGWFTAKYRAKADLQVAAAKHDADMAQAENGQLEQVNKRIEMLMKSYEARIAELTDEVHRLSDKVGALQKELEQRIRHCMSCPMHVPVKEEHHAATDAAA